MRATVRTAQEAWQCGDAVALARSLTRDALVLVDAGDRVAVPVRRATGAAVVAAAMVALTEALPVSSIVEADVNGAPGLMLLHEKRVVGVVGFDMRGRAVSHVWMVVNPAKLTHWNG
jgi:RNA polymerase sigma-70 factor (ECF subfamily)